VKKSKQKNKSGVAAAPSPRAPFRSSADVLLDAMLSAPQSVGSYTHGTPFKSVQEAREMFKAQGEQGCAGDPPESFRVLPEPVHVAGTTVLVLETGDVVTENPEGWTRYRRDRLYDLPGTKGPLSWARLALEISRAELGAQG
jgi:hypothetical protein